MHWSTSWATQKRNTCVGDWGQPAIWSAHGHRLCSVYRLSHEPRAVLHELEFNRGPGATVFGQAPTPVAEIDCSVLRQEPRKNTCAALSGANGPVVLHDNHQQCRLDDCWAFQFHRGWSILRRDHVDNILIWPECHRLCGVLCSYRCDGTTGGSGWHPNEPGKANILYEPHQYGGHRR